MCRDLPPADLNTLSDAAGPSILGYRLGASTLESVTYCMFAVKEPAELAMRSPVILISKFSLLLPKVLDNKHSACQHLIFGHWVLPLS
jgi:hypothetical protein